MNAAELAALYSGAGKQPNQDSAPGYHHDMLHDQHRNRVYREAVEHEVEEDDFVLDIGTGSGLLSLFAARAKAQFVLACEGDAMLASTAKEIVAANGQDESVRVEHKFSTEVGVGFGDDMPCPADVLVTEIFDSALLGEGVLPTLCDAKRRLLSPAARVVPNNATIHCVLVNSHALRCHQRVASSPPLPSPPAPPLARSSTSFLPFQVHADALLQAGLVRVLTSPQSVVRFDFANPVLEGSGECAVAAVEGGDVDAVLFWWSMELDRSGEKTIETTPAWFRGDAHAPIPDRDHWRQACCVLEHPVRVAAGDHVTVRTLFHSEDVWFRVGDSLDNADAYCRATRQDKLAFPAIPRARLLELADAPRQRVLHAALDEVLAQVPQQASESPSPCVLVVDDSALVVAAVASHLGKNAGGVAVGVVHGSVEAVDTSKCLVGEERLGAVHLTHSVPRGGEGGVEGFGCDVVGLVDACKRLGITEQSLAAVVGEPFYAPMATPGSHLWAFDAVLRFWVEVSALRDAGLLQASCRLAPGRARLMARAVQCRELWRRRQPIGQVEGFDLSAFNPPVPEHRSRLGGVLCDVELFPWRRALRPLSDAVQVGVVDLACPFPRDGECAWEGVLEMTAQGECHVVVFWVELDFVSAGTLCVGWSGEQEQEKEEQKEEGEQEEGKREEEGVSVGEVSTRQGVLVLNHEKSVVVGERLRCRVVVPLHASQPARGVHIKPLLRGCPDPEFGVSWE